MKKEHCIICYQETDISEDTPIELRDSYIEGVGQLCPECALKMEKEQRFQNKKDLSQRDC